eukprot:665010-Prorocentrum_lima.AAC.1
MEVSVKLREDHMCEYSVQSMCGRGSSASALRAPSASSRGKTTATSRTGVQLWPPRSCACDKHACLRT